ncbi:MAG: hypothetical protein ACRD27_01055, partial [Terracidiphilus sp.]
MAAASAAALLLVSVVLLPGCTNTITHGDPAPQPPPSSPPPSATQSGSVTMTPPYVALKQGQSFQFAATAGGAKIDWLVNGIPGGNSAVGAVSATGAYTAPAFILK